MRQALLGLLLLHWGCDQMYDEEFERAARVNSVSREERQSYRADLRSTDTTLPELLGEARIDISENEVFFELDLTGVPQNFSQVHYAYIDGDCRQIQRDFQTDLSSLRNMKISENLSTSALLNEVNSSILDLSGKSLVVRAYPVFPTLPDPQGTEAFQIACGELSLDDAQRVDNIDIFTPDSPSRSDREDVGTETFLNF